MFGWWKKRAPKINATIPVDELPDETLSGENVFDCIIGLRSDVGCVREGNEDNARAIAPDDDSERAQRGVLVVVADGMGGHASGEIASALAVEIVCRDYYDAPRKYLQAPSLALRASLEAANAAIYRAASNDENSRRMGTTCTVLVLRGAHAFFGHAGDSRLYLVRAGEIYQLSQDHSIVMELVRQGALSAQQARGHPDKNLITRALGLHPKIEIDIWDEPMPVRDDDRFLLCSDGLCDLLEDAEIALQVLAGPAQDACEALVEAAKARGGHDNITVAIVHARARNLEENVGTDELPVTREVAVSAGETAC